MRQLRISHHEECKGFADENIIEDAETKNGIFCPMRQAPCSSDCAWFTVVKEEFVDDIPVAVCGCWHTMTKVCCYCHGKLIGELVNVSI